MNLVQCSSFSRDDTGLIYLAEPDHQFHGNHWYHFGEYFLAHHNFIEEILKEEHFNNIFIVTSNQNILKLLTQFTFFLLVLTIWNPQIKSIQMINLIEVVNPQTVPQRLNSNLKFQQLIGLKAPYHFNRSVSFFHNFSQYNSTISADINCYSGYFISSIGNIPIPNTKWFHNSSEIIHFQNKISLICDFQPKVQPKVQDSFYYVTIYQRNIKRKILNLKDIVKHLTSILSSKWKIIILYHDETRNPCHLYRDFQLADVFITSHGFQLTGSFMFRPQTKIIELFPDKYFKPTYFTLTNYFQLEHHWLQVSTTQQTLLTSHISLKSCMKSLKCRSYTRNQDLLLNPYDINSLANLIQSFELN